MGTHKKSLVVFSGGQDSVTCLGVAKSCSEKVYAITFSYNQKHARELQSAKLICEKLGVEQYVVDLSSILQNMKSSALINHGDTSQPHSYLKDLPASFVPVRNALFLTAAYGLAMELGCEAIYTGVCQTDYSGYPDCRGEFIRALNASLNLGYNSKIDILTPLMYRTKAETFSIAESAGVLDIVINDSMTCYDGVETKNGWGMGCGECPACRLRKQGWSDYMNKGVVFGG